MFDMSAMLELCWNCFRAFGAVSYGCFFGIIALLLKSKYSIFLLSVDCIAPPLPAQPQRWGRPQSADEAGVGSCLLAAQLVVVVVVDFCSPVALPFFQQASPPPAELVDCSVVVVVVVVVVVGLVCCQRSASTPASTLILKTIKLGKDSNGFKRVEMTLT